MYQCIKVTFFKVAAPLDRHPELDSLIRGLSETYYGLVHPHGLMKARQ